MQLTMVTDIVLAWYTSFMPFSYLATKWIMEIIASESDLIAYMIHGCIQGRRNAQLPICSDCRIVHLSLFSAVHSAVMPRTAIKVMIFGLWRSFTTNTATNRRLSPQTVRFFLYKLERCCSVIYLDEELLTAPFGAKAHGTTLALLCSISKWRCYAALKSLLEIFTFKKKPNIFF